ILNKMNTKPLHDTLRKRKTRVKENSNQCEIHRACDRKNKRAKRAVKTTE
ncbi:73_t:CDS:1, partial [Funneliformis caledonium]